MIKHIEDLKPNDLLKFLKDWNVDKKTFLVTEKIDGNAMSFGLENGKFFLASKNRTFRSASDVPELYFMKDFRRFFELLQEIPLYKIVESVTNEFGYAFDGTINITGEAVPTYNHNIVIYDKNKIKDGIFVIFSTIVGEKDIADMKFWKRLSEEINKFTTVKIYSVPDVNLSDLNFSNKLIVSLEDLIKNNGNFLNKPARTEEEKTIKNQVLDAVKKIGSSAKQQVLQTKFNSLFGDEYEGIVFRDSDGNLVKVVEKDKFTQRKQQNWHFIDKLIVLQNTFKKSLKTNPGDIKSSLNNWLSGLSEVEKDFVSNKDKFITIDKKEQDTRDEISFQKSMIKKLQTLLSSESPEEISRKYLNREIMPEHPSKKGKFLNEGGNAFSEVNSVVPRKLLEKNIENALEISGFKDLSYELIGNTNKTFLGDIDIAVDSKELQNKYGISKENFWKDLENFLTKQNIKFKIIKGLSQFHLLSDLVSDNGKVMAAISKDGTVLKEPGKIQIDLFVGNTNWLSKTMSGAPAESKYKAVYRNLFLISSFAIIKWPTKNNPSIFNKLELGKDGFKLVQKQTDNNKTKKISEKTFSVNPDVVAQILFNKTIKWSDINSFEKFYSLFNSEQFRFKNSKQEIINEFLVTINRNHLPVPKELNNNI